MKKHLKSINIFQVHLTMEYNENPLNWISFVGMGILVLTALTLMILLIVSILRMNKTDNIKYSKRSGLIAISVLANITFTISSMLFFIQTYVCMDQNTGASEITTKGKIGMGFYIMSQTIMMFVFTIRIDVTFDGSTLEYSKYTVRTLYALSTCLSIFLISIIICLAAHLLVLSFLCAALWLLLYFALSIFLVILFNRKMDRLIIASKKHLCTSQKNLFVADISKANNLNESEYKNNNESNSIIKELIDNQFLYIVTKHGLLVPVSICSSFILFMLALIIGFVIDSNAWIPYSVVWCVLDCNINSFCNYLLFGFNKNVYNKICWKFHSICEKWKLFQYQQTIKNKPNAKNSEMSTVQIKEKPCGQLQHASSEKLLTHDEMNKLNPLPKLKALRTW
eukprot:322815_1